MPLFAREDCEIIHPAPGPSRPPDGGQPPGQVPSPLDRLQPRLRALAKDLANRLTKSEGLFLFPHLASRKAGKVPEPGPLQPDAVEVMAAIGRGRTHLGALPFLAVGLSHSGLHVHLVVPSDTTQSCWMGGGLREQANRLARHHASFGLMRLYTGWDGIGLPEVAPVRSAAFWDTLGLRLSMPDHNWLDLGTAWASHEVASVERDDLLRTLKRFLPLYRMAMEEGFSPILR